MNLAVFDVDGTLTDTSGVDARCFVRALEEAFGVADGSSDWEEYLHVTDSGITREVFDRKYERPPTGAETQVFIDRFLALLQEDFRSEPGGFAEIPGAGHLVDALPRVSHWRAGIATGGWRTSAEFKMRCAGIPFDEVPLATADDGISREEIIGASISRARVEYSVDRFSKIVSVGDGSWDLKTAKNMDLSFIGVGDEGRLRELGAPDVVTDFEDVAGFVRLLEIVEPLT